MKPASPTPARIALGIVAAMALSIPLGIALHSNQQLNFLARTQQTTIGMVTKKHCENHGKFFYSYAVDGRVYRGAGAPHGISCMDLNVGDRIHITYSSERPQLSTPNSLDPDSEASINIFGFALMGLAAAVVIFRITSFEDENFEDKN